MQLFKCVFVVLFAWQCTIANALELGEDPLGLGDVLPGLPDIGDVLPGLPDIGDVLPGLPDIGDVLPGLPDIGELLPDIGELLPGLADLLLGSICRREAVARGVGTAVTALCTSDEEEVAGLCYPKCRNGYESIAGFICRKIGCGGLAGAKDIGATCEKPKAYNRGVAYFDLSKCELENVLCERWGLLFYPTCNPGFSLIGCCSCSPNCPADYIDDIAFCRKDFYLRDVGVIRLGCESDKEYNIGLCYTPCSNNGIGVGPLCLSTCSGENSVPCGVFCTSNLVKCAATTVELATSALNVTANMVDLSDWDAIVAVFEGEKEIAAPNVC